MGDGERFAGGIFYPNPNNIEYQNGTNQGLDSTATIKNISSSVMEDES